MLRFLNQYSDAMLVILNLLMVLIWAVYAQFFYRNYRRSRRPRVMINLARDTAFRQARCLVCNMSQGPILIEAVLVAVTDSEGSVFYRDVTERAHRRSQSPDIRSDSRQGPLQSGDYKDLGSLVELFSDGIYQGDHGTLVVQRTTDFSKLVQRAQVCVLCTYGPEDRALVGAFRDFRVAAPESGPPDDPNFWPLQVVSPNISGSWKSQQVQVWLKRVAAFKHIGYVE